MQEHETCSLCGERIPLDEICCYVDQLLCPSCLEQETLLCDRCGERIWREENAGSEDVPLCQSCYDSYYTSCDHCHRIILLDEVFYDNEEEDIPLCCDCHAEVVQYSAIRNYYYKPEPIFYGEGDRFFGVELEIDDAGEYGDNARRLLEIANEDNLEHLYCKHDGSLDEGFELVTHPMTLQYHKEVMPWRDILEEAVRMGYRSHQTNTCGYHVHINRTAFGSTHTEQDEAIARILYFFEKFWDELLKFSRRTPRQLDHWAARYGLKDRPGEILEHAKKGYGGGRYSSVNLENHNTIEFRIFRGTLKYNTIIATLQLLNRICDVALFLSDDELTALSWTTFAAGCNAPELVQYLKERRLYINEPVEMEEEL